MKLYNNLMNKKMINHEYMKTIFKYKQHGKMKITNKVYSFSV